MDETSSSHALVRVIAPDGRAAVVKQASPASVAAGRSLARELFVYRLGAWIPGVAAPLPEPVLLDEARQVIAIEALDTGVPWPDSTRTSSIASRGLAEQLGTLMAGWHRATTDTALWVSPASGILHLPDAVQHAAEGRPPATVNLMRLLADDPDLAGTLRHTRSRWRDRCLIHGDIRRENWILRRKGRRAALHVIDWELSGSGDPAWDLGSALAEFVLDNVRGDPDQTVPLTEAQEPRMRAFFAAYIGARGVLRPRRVEDWNHVVSCCVARLLHVACEWSDVQATVDGGPAARVVAHARDLLRRRPELVARLMSRRW